MTEQDRNAEIDAPPKIDPNADPTPPRPPRPTGPVQYKGADLDAERGPGLSVAWHWPEAVSAILLFAVIGLLLTTGQTIIFLLRLVAADRRSRRRPLRSATKTVGELEDEGEAGEDAQATRPER